VIGNDPRVTLNKTEGTFYYENGSVLYTGGMKDDAQREALRSIGQDGSLDIVWIEEANAFTRMDLDELLARMRGKAAPWQQIILTTNPDVPTHWINQDLIIGGQASVYYSSAHDNPHNPPVYLEILKRLTGVLYQRLALGRWVQAEGVVYDEWDAGLHLIDPFPIPAHWKRYRVIDFGYTNPFVCLWIAEDPDGRLYLYREIYMTQRLVEDHARQILELDKGERIEFTVADHDAEDRATLERHGVPTVPAIKDVSPGIQAVKQRLNKAGDGKPRLYILRGALVEEDSMLRAARKPLCTHDEILAYAWPKGVDGKPVKEQPVKIDDHGMDGLRYIVYYLDGNALATWDDLHDLGTVEDYESKWA
jgi:phage terminase large subunit